MSATRAGRRVGEKERDLARDELRFARVDPFDAFERGRHVGADASRA